LEIQKRLGDKIVEAEYLGDLAWSLFEGGQLDEAEAVSSRVINLLPGKGGEYLICHSHRLLGSIYDQKREKEKAIHHFEAALRIATPFMNWHDQLFWAHYGLSILFYHEDELDNANTHIQQAKANAVHDTYNLGCAMQEQATIWWLGGRLEDAKSEALHALEIFEKLGAAGDLKTCGDVLQEIEKSMENTSTSG